MYCYYYTTASWTLTQVADDLAAILTGADISSLSASCNKTLSHKNGTTIAPGWEMHDSNTGQSVKGFVIKAPDVDALTTKYVNIWTSGTVSITLRVLEDWDAAANTTTNAGHTHTAMSLGTVGVAVALHIIATPQYILISNGSAGNNSVGHMEVLRDTPYLADATVKPLVHMSFHGQQLYASNANNFFLPRLRNPRTGATLLTTSAGLLPMTIGPRYLNAVTQVVQVNTTNPTIASDGSSFNQAYPAMFGWLDSTQPNVVYHGRAASNANGYPPVFLRADLTGAQIGDLIRIDDTDYIYVMPTYGFALPWM